LKAVAAIEARDRTRHAAIDPQCAFAHPSFSAAFGARDGRCCNAAAAIYGAGDVRFGWPKKLSAHQRREAL
jgi:hypothetical protein